MSRVCRPWCWVALLWLAFSAQTSAAPKHKALHNLASAPVQTQAVDGRTEARLINIYRLIGIGQTRDALAQAQSLVQDTPNFQLAQLVYGDLLASRVRPLAAFGDVPVAQARNAAGTLDDLREESLLRLKALRERPPAGTVPQQFASLSPSTRHAIAVDASTSRLYLFENGSNGLHLVSDYYISLGKAGTAKTAEGDQRTPLGVYYITSNLDRKTLKDFYGAGALPINYPNVLDAKRGKTGKGIWLHGTPPSQFSRAPLATDGCVVLANADLEYLIRTVEIRKTPVVIAPALKWVPPQHSHSEAKSFEDTFFAWRNAKSSGRLTQVLPFYAADFNSYGRNMEQWRPSLEAELAQAKGRIIQIKDLSYLRWVDQDDTMVVTFGEVITGANTGATKRQYWVHQGHQWKIFFEGVI